MGHDTFQVGDLTAVIGDNEAYEKHRAGYNGIHGLVHRTQAEPLFVPGVAGLNLEHYFDGHQDLTSGDDIFFEPRRSPMIFRRVADDEAELHQPPTPTFHVESWTRFKLVPPHFIDFSFRFVPHQHAFRHGYLGIFWASYINGPEDKSLYLRGGKRWLQLCSPAHNAQSTVLHRDDKTELKFVKGGKDSLYQNFSPLRFDEPLYYGHFGSHVLIMMFDRTEGLRITHSPSGGGNHGDRETTNPAWDWQFVLPAYEVLKEYSIRARAVYRERCSRAEILAEYERWRGQR